MRYIAAAVIYLLIGHFLAYHVLRNWHRSHPELTPRERARVNKMQIIMMGYLWPLGVLIGVLGTAACFVSRISEVHAERDLTTHDIPDDV